MLSLLSILALVLPCSLVRCHTIITYPGWRGNNLHFNGTEEDNSVPSGSLGINYDSETESYTFPYGMEWMYPCGGMPTSTNRTKWPITGGAVAVQPGWFSGHETAFIYINMGFGTEPQNMSNPMVPVFQIEGPSNEMYEGEFCLPQVPLPVNATVNVGDNATIQVIEAAVHGASLYNCVDITFAEPEEVAEVNETNCRNSTEPLKEIGFNMVFSTESESSSSSVLISGAIVFSTLATIATLLSLWL